ncbi:hypothetical protein HCA89_13530 [Listeria innocua]|uniref:Crp/Fnr family transcriptional regulator n=1 Tax=Listeria innocua TaxID=1642 RepID=A0AB73HBZ2_LISIO|nr:hypothetical protein [Listeria innocua]EHF3619319.1 hypothetical protein [Listeria innocua]MBC1909842.1 hypothetical protein [Listeria innocua]MBC1927704.1 hypothetical protein [Listeria innocua]MBC2143339.1 hypothetical protein [Listeria innocua]MBC2237846.1 hypothetical protein [Listeria innocua]
MMGMFTTELIFTLTSNPKFQEVAELVYWNKDDIIDCPENNEFVYAIDEGSVTQYAEKNSSWGKGSILGFIREKTKIHPLCKTVAWKIPLTYVADIVKNMDKVKLEDLTAIEMNFLKRETKDCIQWFIKKMPDRLHTTSWKIAQGYFRQEIMQILPKESYIAQLNELKERHILFELGYYFEINVSQFHSYLRNLEYDLILEKNN